MKTGKWLWHGGVVHVTLIRWDRASSPNFVILKRIDTDFGGGGGVIFSYLERERPRDDFASSFAELKVEAKPSQLRAALVHLFSSTEIKVEIE
jgi:hypothetical protein